LIKLNIGKVNKFFLFLGICIFLLLISTNTIFSAEKQPILRVGIFLNQTEINISGDGTFKIYNLKSNSLISEEKSKTFKLLPHDKGIEILGKGVYSGPVRIIPVGNSKIMVVTNGQKYRYRGNIEIEKEISPRWPKETLKAQAIAARTFAIFNMNKYIDKGYNICATTNSQAYGGVNHEDPLTNKAVDETRGVIMVYKGEPINAVYHSDSGGYTEDSENVWGSFLPYLRSVESKFEEKVSPPHHTWSYSINEKELTEKLQKQGYEVNSVVSIEAVNKSQAGRISELVFTADNIKVINMKTNDFRSLIGADLIRSTLFSIKIIGKEISIAKDTEDKKEIEDKEEQEESVKEILEQKKDWTIKELLELMKKNKEEKEKEKEEEIPKLEIVKSNIPLTYQDILKYYYQGINIIKKY